MPPELSPVTPVGVLKVGSRTVVIWPAKTFRILWFPLSAMYSVPVKSIAMPAGYDNCAEVAATPSPADPDDPVPATVWISPSGVTRRMRCPLNSAIYSPPKASTATLRGEFSWAATAGPPSPADPAWPDLAYALTSRAQIPEFVQRDKRANVDLIKAYANLSDRMLRNLVEEAHKEKIRVVIDQWERNGSPDLVRTGIDGFAHAPTRKMPGDDIQLIHERGMFVITTLVVEEYSGRRRMADLRFLEEPLIAETTPPWFLTELRAEAARTLSEAEKKDVEKSAVGFEEMKRNVKKLLDAGVLLAAGTDAPYPGVFQGEAIHHELELLVEAGMTPLQAVRTATYNAAQIMHAEHEWGSLQPGRAANLVIVAGNPAARISDTRKIETLILNGKILDRASLRYDAKKDPGFRAVTGNFNSPVQ